MSTLNIYGTILGYADDLASNEPLLRLADWKRSIQGLAVGKISTQGPVSIPAGTEVVFFNGSRTLAVDGTTSFDLSNVPSVASDLYRVEAMAGTAPAFRVDRGLDLATVALTLTAQANGTLVVASAVGTPFSVLQASDEVFLPGVSTGDAASPFSLLNLGSWVVLGIGSAGATVTLQRPAGQSAVMASEVVTPTAASQVQGFGSAGVQVGDTLDLLAGFSSLQSMEIVAVTASRLDVISSSPMANESGILPGAAGMAVYTSAKRLVEVEVDQDCVVRVNGDTGSTMRLSPWEAGDSQKVAQFRQVGPCWSLSVYNRSPQALRAYLITVE